VTIKPAKFVASAKRLEPADLKTGFLRPTVGLKRPACDVSRAFEAQKKTKEYLLIREPGYLDSLAAVIDGLSFDALTFESSVETVSRAIFENFIVAKDKAACRFVYTYVAKDATSINEIDLNSPSYCFGEIFEYDPRLLSEFRLAASRREQKIVYLIRNADSKLCFEERRVHSIVCLLLFLPGGVTISFMIGLKPFISLALTSEFDHFGLTVRMRLCESTGKPDYPSASLLDMAPDALPVRTKENLAVAKAALREKVVETVNTDFADLIPHIAWTATPGGKVDFVNRQWFEYTGQHEQRDMSKEQLKFYHQDDFLNLTRKWLYSLATNEPLEVEQRVKRGADNTYRWHLIRATALLDDDGCVVKWFGTVTDIENQKQTEKMLRDIMDNVNVAIWWKDLQSVYLGCNKTLAKDAGLADPSLIAGLTDFDLPWTTDEAEAFRRDDARVMQNNQSAIEFAESVSHQCGKHALVVTSKIPMLDSNAKVVGVLGMYEDITEKENMRIQREDFMSSLAHDMKVPVVAAARVLEFMLRGAAGELKAEQTDCLKMLFSSNERLLFLIHNLLEVLNLDAGKAPSKSNQFDLNRLVSAQLTRSEAAFLSKGLTLRQKLTNKSLSFVACESEFKRAIENLITNAITLAAKDSTIKIESDRSDTHLLLELNIDCAPITEEEQEYLFERFWQGSKLGMSVGLGFYLCRRIVERRGGEIKCTSSNESGTTFKISVPFDEPDQDPHSPSVMPSLQRRLY
jgi:PAS domain S-box-containing protein